MSNSDAPRPKRTEQNISIRIADVSPISMKIQPDAEELVRRAEKHVNKVWSKWRSEFPNQTSKEILAMVAYQFAKNYFELSERIQRQQQLLNDFENELDRLLEISGDSRVYGSTLEKG